MTLKNTMKYRFLKNSKFSQNIISVLHYERYESNKIPCIFYLLFTLLQQSGFGNFSIVSLVSATPLAV